MRHWLYLHGFLSGPGSAKVSETRAYLAPRAAAVTLHCPALSPYPAQALAQTAELIASLPQPPLLIGSSLGGFYATALAERFALPAVLINPALQPDAQPGIFGCPQFDPNRGTFFTLGEADRAALRAAAVTQPTLARYWLVLGSADAVIDWREAARRYAGARTTVLNGDDHRLARWPQCLPAIDAWHAAG